MEKFVLIMGGGSGSRMGGDIPKQFIELNGKPLILHTISRFTEFDPSVNLVVVLPAEQFGRWNDCCIKQGFRLRHQLVAGGQERYFSVRNGLEAIDRDGIVFIHDAVRPLVSIDTIIRCYNCASEQGNAVPVWQVSESLRKKETDRNVAVDRSDYYVVQTPQTFDVALIKKAYHHDFVPGFTDDATVLESSGVTVNLVQGNRENIKITFPEDLRMASLFL